MRICAWPSFLPIRTACVWSPCTMAGSEEVILKYWDFVNSAFTSAPFRPITVYGCVSPTVRTTGVRGSSQTAFQLIPEKATPVNSPIAKAKSCRRLLIGNILHLSRVYARIESDVKGKGHDTRRRNMEAAQGDCES